MAIMYPPYGPRFTTSPEAEPDLYQRFKEQLNDDFRVIHSIPWLASVTEHYVLKHSGIGEIDFLVMHPELGILALEVKGGALSHDRSGFYYQKCSGGDRQYIDPYQQASRGRFALQNILKTHHGRVKIGIALVLHGSEMRSADLPPALYDPNSGQRLVLDMHDLNALEPKLSDIMQHYQSVFQSPPLSVLDIERLIDAILPTADYGPCWLSRIQNDDVVWLKMTDEQTECTERAVRQHRTLITGWPGSGKTIVGISAARQLSDLRKSVLFLAFNERLTRKIASELKDHRHCMVYTFHQLCRHAESFLGIAKAERDGQWHQAGSAQSLQQAIQAGFLDNYDTLMVDEAQIIRTEWWDALFTYFDDRTIIAMCDETQVFPFEAPVSLAELEQRLSTERFLLTQSLRVPKKVCNTLKIIIQPKYSVTNPRTIDEDTFEERVSSDIDQTLYELAIEFQGDNIPPNQVVFLFEHKHIIPDWLAELGYTVDTIARFRGVEAPIVVACVLGAVSDIQLFCAYSRCTSRCIMVTNVESVATGLLPHIDKATKERAVNAHTLKLERQAYALKQQTIHHLIHHPPLTRIDTDIKSIAIQWCEEWQHYVLIGSSEQDALWQFWSLYLLTVESPPIFSWIESDERSTSYPHL